MAFWEKIWCRLFGRVNIPGVVYSDEIDATATYDRQQRESMWRGNLRNVRLDTVPPLLLRTSGAENALLGPEEEPYTFWERVGVVPVHPSRVRPRQYYHPITDFGLYDYDEVSPEERDLTARWLAKVLEFNAAVPLGILCAAGCLVLPLHTVYRMPLLVASAATGVMFEITHSYMNAGKERQDLDDFILAKEIWYIKNVEAYQLDIPLIPKGREAEYQAFLDGSNGTSQMLPDELAEALH
ncbi:uncharacterized protein TEOVI_000011500 [Trypanosoma equiperdum]|uniref:Uncharacterized protein n=2 Tax=Trypanozoon TaxID=39700 RepID=Q57ZT9_TRYB2|nr:hypothetical protein, conserved [Trypanosoma brucei brucei TREU927]AAX79385.1 hypothetical protein, conserved [Trypanosoma brucei]AAZ11376.1 hypothetical protein, conserved [Trypanosoma brucei brucei TREU927]SCU64722.1 hypothetical protein, conserved [Trypanosoma equiperdum]